MFEIATLFLFCAIFGGITIGTVAADDTTLDPNCKEPWFVTVSPELVVTWSGVNRSGDVRVDYKAINPPTGVKCVNKKLSVSAHFNEYEFSIAPLYTACRGTQYNVTVKLVCDDVNDGYDFVVSVPPDELTAVENIAEVSVADKKITIKWDELKIHGRSDIFYTVQWHALEANSSEENSTAALSYTISNLKPYTEYSIRVRAHSGQEMGNWSEELIVRTKAGVPSEPRNVKTTCDSTTLWIEWEEPMPFQGPILSYTVLWRLNKINSTDKYTRDNTSNLYYVVQDLIPLTNYFVRVRAWTEAGRGSFNPIVIMCKTKRPVAPENLKNTSITSRSVEVSWDEPSVYLGRRLIVGYSIQWTNVETNESEVDNTTEVKYKIGGLHPFTNYTVEVCAWTENGLGDWTQPLRFQTEIGDPDPPENLRKTSITSQSIEVTWDEPPLHYGKGLIKGYSVEWTHVDSNDTDFANSTKLSYKIANLYPYTNYTVRVRAFTENGFSEWTNPLTVLTEIGIPDPPELLHETATSPRTIDIAWNEPILYAGRGLISMYSVKWISMDTYEKRTDNTTDLAFKIVDLSPFANYSVSVRAWTEYGAGKWTNPLLIQTKIGVPSPPEKLKAGKVTDTTIDLTWEVPKEYKTLVTKHTVKWKRMDSIQEQTDNTEKSEYVLRRLDPVTDYNISVRSWTADGAGNWSDPKNVRTAVGVPSVPINVTFTDIRQTSMRIVWEEPQPYRGPILFYIIQWGTVDSDHSENNVSIERWLLLPELNPYTVYWAQVSASSYAGAGELSTRVEARTAVGIPSTPRNLTEMEATNTTIKLQWKEPRPANGPIELYTVRWTNLNNEIPMNETTTSLDYFIKNLDPYTNHSIEVRATTKAGSGDWSDSLVIRTGIGVPSEPIGLDVRKVTDASMELIWKEPDPIVGIIEHYILQWNNTITKESKKMKANGNSAIIRSLDPYTEYSVRVSAATSAGQGNWTESRIFRTASGIPVPPQNLRNLNVTNCTIDLQWDTPKSFKGPIMFYSVRWTNVSSGQSWFKNTGGMLYTIEGLDAYTSYNIVVRAKTETGYGPWSNNITVRTAIGIPTVPQELTMAYRTPWSIGISWNAPYPSNGPLVNYEIAWGVPGTELQHNLTNDTLFKAEHLLPYTNYSFQVSAATEVGYGPHSLPLVIITEIAIPSVPMNLNLTSTTNTSLSIEWEKPQPSNGPILGYSLQWGKFGASILSKETTLSKYKIADLDPYTNYSIQISAKTAAGYGPWTEPLAARTLTSIPSPAVLSLVDVESSRSISVQWHTLRPYPGPTNYSLEVWRKPGQCEAFKEDLREKSLQGDKAADDWGSGRTETVEGLTPYSQYYVRVVLVTDAGGSESQNSTTVRTLPESPEAPTKVRANCGQSSTEAEVRWNPPLRSNGKIIEYIVKYGVENYGYEKSTLAATSQCREHRIHLRGLRPEKKYRIRVQAKTEGISKVGEEGHMENYCVLPAGVPPMGKTEYIKATGSGSFQLIFEWSQDVFSDSMGSLVNYAILVGQPEAVENATSGKSIEVMPPWANFSAGASSFYQATPQEWNPFEKGTSDPLNCEEIRTDDGVEIRLLLKCTVGGKSQCSSEEPYCNGPLTPDTHYGLKIRAFTRGGYSETGAIYAKTGPVPGSSLVGGLVGGFMFLLLVSAFIVGTFILKRKGKLEELRLVVLARFRPQPASSTSNAPRPPSEQILQLESYPAVRKLTAENFAEHVRIMMSDSHLRFSQEFEALKHNSPKFTCSIAEMEENRSKNRWLNIFPYDHSRVKLLPLGDDPESDFINANYIPGYSSLREYIACQGPLTGTVDDMWRMVWEQATTMIVMLTQCVERGKNKCEQYWPSPAGEARFFGDIQVKTLSESMLSSYIIRVFHVQLGSQTRMVKQMHFTHWPDFGCPESPDDLINFIRAVRDHLPRIRPGPILVHCSAGVGRTGTFIAVDRLSQQLRHSVDIDIYGTVMELRHHRVNMVQTEDQYIYIHLCVNQLLEESNESTEDEYEEAIYSNVGMEIDTGV